MDQALNKVCEPFSSLSVDFVDPVVDSWQAEASSLKVIILCFLVYHSSHLVFTLSDPLTLSQASLDVALNVDYVSG